jgi:hypothetical protein
VRVVPLTYVNSGAIIKQTVRWSAGESLRFSLAPKTGSIDTTGWSFRLVISDTVNDPALVDKTEEDFTVLNVSAGTRYVDVGSDLTFTWPTNVYAGEIRRVDAFDNKLLARFENEVTANPLASNAALVPAGYQPSWEEILNKPADLDDNEDLPGVDGGTP